MSDREKVHIPAGFKEVTKETFFSTVGAKDVIPTHSHDFYTLWELRDRTVIGWSAPGWRNPSDGPKRYAVKV